MGYKKHSKSDCNWLHSIAEGSKVTSGINKEVNWTIQ
jgi:hypothetical protein